jgi:hypothetical protein
MPTLEGINELQAFAHAEMPYWRLRRLLGHVFDLGAHCPAVPNPLYVSRGVSQPLKH